MNDKNRWRLGRMLSYYNMVLAYALYFISLTQHKQKRSAAFGGVFRDTVAALAIFVALGVGLFYIQYGVSGVQHFYSNLFGVEVPTTFAILIDTIVHFVPPLLLGMPLNPFAFIWASVLIIGWYLSIREDFKLVYDNEDFSNFSDISIFSTLPIVCGVLVAIRYFIPKQK